MDDFTGQWKTRAGFDATVDNATADGFTGFVTTNTGQKYSAMWDTMANGYHRGKRDPDLDLVERFQKKSVYA